jgi:hypothetical protein
VNLRNRKTEGKMNCEKSAQYSSISDAHFDRYTGMIAMQQTMLLSCLKMVVPHAE